MAEPQEPQPGTDDVADDAVDAPSDGSKRFWLLLIPVLILVTAGGGWVSYSQYATMHRIVNSYLADSTDESSEVEPIEYGMFTETQGIIVNPAGSGGSRYLMVKLGLESDRSAVIEELEEKNVVVRDVVINLLSEQDIDRLSNITFRETLKDTLRQSINAVIQEGQIDRLYFTQYVLQ